MAFFKYNKKNVYYRTFGKGEPLLMIHGNSVSSRMFAPIIKYYKKDFQLILMNKPVSYLKPYWFKGQKEDEKYYAYHEGKDYYYYITNKDCTSLLRLERGSNTKKVTEALMQLQKDGVPESIGIQHKNFNFEINLKRIEENAEQ